MSLSAVLTNVWKAVCTMLNSMNVRIFLFNLKIFEVNVGNNSLNVGSYSLNVGSYSLVDFFVGFDKS